MRFRHPGESGFAPAEENNGSFSTKILFRHIGFCELALFDTDLGNHESAGKSYLQKTFDVNCQKLRPLQIAYFPALSERLLVTTLQKAYKPAHTWARWLAAGGG